MGRVLQYDGIKAETMIELFEALRKRNQLYLIPKICSENDVELLVVLYLGKETFYLLRRCGEEVYFENNTLKTIVTTNGFVSKFMDVARNINCIYPVQVVLTFNKSGYGNFRILSSFFQFESYVFLWQHLLLMFKRAVKLLNEHPELYAFGKAAATRNYVRDGMEIPKSLYGMAKRMMFKNRIEQEWLFRRAIWYETLRYITVARDCAVIIGKHGEDVMYIGKRNAGYVLWFIYTEGDRGIERILKWKCTRAFSKGNLCYNDLKILVPSDFLEFLERFKRQIMLARVIHG